MCEPIYQYQITGSRSNHCIIRRFDTADLLVESAEVHGKPVTVRLFEIGSCAVINTTVTLQYELKTKHAVMGSALHIPLPSGLKYGSSISVKVTYKTTKDCTALQWLEKEYLRPIVIIF